MNLAVKGKSKKVYGYHLILDMYDCKADTMEDIKLCYKYLDELPKLLEIDKLSPPFIVYTDGEKYPDKAGLSGWIPLVEPLTSTYSGASIHTLTPTNFISIDVFSCKKFNPQKIKKFTVKTFGPKKIEDQYFPKGKYYSG